MHDALQSHLHQAVDLDRHRHLCSRIAGPTIASENTGRLFILLSFTTQVLKQRSTKYGYRLRIPSDLSEDAKDLVRKERGVRQRIIRCEFNRTVGELVHGRDHGGLDEVDENNVNRGGVVCNIRKCRADEVRSIEERNRNVGDVVAYAGARLHNWYASQLLY